MRTAHLLIALTGLLGSAVVVSSASAAAGVLGTGAHPALAVDGAGVGHVAWVVSDPNGDVVHYCRLERTDPPTCGNPQTLTSPDGVVDDVQVVVDGGDVRIIMPRNESNDVQMWSSSGGGPFSGPFQIATGPVGSTAPDAVLGADGNAFFTNANPGPIVQQVPVHGGPPPGRSASFAGAYTADPTVGVFGASSFPLLAAHGGAPDRAAFWRYNGTGDVNDPASWAGPVVIGDGDATRLASGPAGLFLMTNNAGGSSGGQVQVRRFDDLRGNFTAPVIVGPSEAGVENDLAEAPAGGPAAGALFPGWALSSSDRLRVAAWGDGGRTWLGPGDLLHENNVFGLRAAVAPDGRGFVAWDQNSDSGQVKAAPLVARDDTPPVLGISKVGRAADGNPQWTISCPANEAFCQ